MCVSLVSDSFFGTLEECLATCSHVSVSSLQTDRSESIIAFLSTQYEIKLYLFDKMKKYYDMREEKNESITDTIVRCNECFS
jgi:hypothetical protein